MKLIVLTLGSWAAGVAGLLLSYAVLFDFQSTFSGEYLMEVLLISLLVALIVFPAVYLPSMLLLRRVLRGCTRRVWFPVTAALLGVISTFLIFLLQGSERAAVVSPDAFVHYSMFVAAGVAFGLGFVRFYGYPSTTRRLGGESEGER